MMIETSLIKLDDAVREGQKLSAGTKVVLPTSDEADIYGFIAIEDNLFSSIIDMPPLGGCQVFSNRVIFYLDKHLYRFPIFGSVSKAREERYGLYLLYVPKFLNLSADYYKRYYVETMCKENPHPKVCNIKGVRIEKEVAYYYSDEHDLYFESRSKLRGIGNGFVVVTRRISKLSGDIRYEVFDSHSVMTERK